MSGDSASSAVEFVRRSIATFRELLLSHRAMIDRLNVYPVPDGDTGTNMARTLDSVVAEMNEADDGLAAVCDAVSHGALMGARGNSGVIVSQILRGIAATLKRAADEESEPTGELVAAALTAASDGAYSAVLTPVEGTILTVAREAAAGATAAHERGESLGEVLLSARERGRAALERTPELLPVLADAGVVDAGGAGYLLLVDAALHVVTGEPLPEPPADLAAIGGVEVTRQHADGDGNDGEQRYEVMFLCTLDDERIEDLKRNWGEIGDSIVVVGGDGTWNCHVHTNDIGAAIETPLELAGRPFQIRVTDLFEEVAAEHAQREARLLAAAGEAVAVDGDEPDEQPPELAPVTCAVVAVASGPGIADLFRQLGVHVVVHGGKTLNPSTAELLDAVEQANAEQVVLLPGNKNIIPVAEHVDSATARTVRVVPTRSMPEGLAALIAYDPEADAPANVLPMRSAADSVATGEVTQAVRDSNTPAGPVQEGDWIGLRQGDGVAAVADSAVGAAQALLTELVGDDSELVTVITGSDAADADVDALVEWFGERFPGVELEVHAGGQPLYPYLFGVE